jgi:hypothetical protein
MKAFSSSLMPFSSLYVFQPSLLVRQPYTAAQVTVEGCSDLTFVNVLQICLPNKRHKIVKIHAENDF